MPIDRTGLKLRAFRLDYGGNTIWAGSDLEDAIAVAMRETRCARELLVDHPVEVSLQLRIRLSDGVTTVGALLREMDLPGLVVAEAGER